MTLKVTDNKQVRILTGIRPDDSASQSLHSFALVPSLTSLSALNRVPHIQTIKHQTDQQDQLKKYDKLNEFFLTAMTKSSPAPPSDSISAQ